VQACRQVVAWWRGLHPLLLLLLLLLLWTAAAAAAREGLASQLGLLLLLPQHPSG
jgi:hypothetical protein